MKINNQKLLKYSSAVGALLAVSGGAKAVALPGEIMLGYTPTNLPSGYVIDGDAILNHNNDLVFIDMDNDGEPDFFAMMAKFSIQATPSNSSFSYASSSSVYVMFGAYNGSGLVGLDNYNAPFINNFDAGDRIGEPEMRNASDMGILTFFSNGAPSNPTSTIPQPVTFNRFGDQGFVGVAMGNGAYSNYGYIQVDIDVNSQSVELISCALETEPGRSIAAGAIVPLLPIASAAGLGLIGLMAAMKKRRKNKVI